MEGGMGIVGGVMPFAFNAATAHALDDDAPVAAAVGGAEGQKLNGGCRSPDW